MSLAISSPVTGGAATGFTSPTYTVTEDTGPSVHSIQYAVTALGGTQTGVDAHSISQPFTVTFERPAQYQSLPSPNPVTGEYRNVPRNRSILRVRKGVEYATDKFAPAMAEVHFLVPAGSDQNDAPNIRAMVSLLVGVLSQKDSETGDFLIDGLL